MPNVYLNDRFLPLEQATVSVLDRGFLFGDGVYEVIPVYGKQLFLLDEHLLRLERSLTAIGMQNPYDKQQWRAILTRLVADTPGADLTIYLQVTRGAGPNRDHAIADGLRPTLFAMASAPRSPTDEQRRDGVSCITADDIRWSRCDIKAITLLAAVLLRHQASEAGAQETLLLRDGQLTEGSTTNVFAVIDDTLVTPPNSHLLLPGVTRGLVLDLAQQAGFATDQRPIAAAELVQAQELWVTSSTKEVLAVVELDGQRVGDGRPGPYFITIQQHYRRFTQQVRDQAQ